MKSRLFQIGLVFLLSFNQLYTQSNNEGLTAWWQFEKLENKSTPETISGSNSLVNGFQKLKEGVKGKGFLFDGYTSYLEDINEKSFELKDGFTLSAWIAIQAYPWNWVGIVDKQINQESGYNLSLDANGYVRFEVAVNGKLVSVKSSQRIDLLKWAQITGVFNPANGLKLFINDEVYAESDLKGNYTPSKDIPIWIGRSHIKLAPAYPIRMDLPASYSFDGIIDEVKIFNIPLTNNEVKQNYASEKPENEKGLEFRKSLLGPKDRVDLELIIRI